jgi:hypothetical protein
MQRIIFVLILASIAETATGGRGRCRTAKDIYNGGVYVKTLCTVDAAVDYHGGKTTCKNAGMKLFVPEDAFQVEQLKTKLAEEFGDRELTRLWISGKRYGSKWMADTSERQSYDFDSTFSQGSGECLVIVRRTKFGNSTIEGWGCSGIAWPYCEFRDHKS